MFFGNFHEGRRDRITCGKNISPCFFRAAEERVTAIRFADDLLLVRELLQANRHPGRMQNRRGFAFSPHFLHAHDCTPPAPRSDGRTNYCGCEICGLAGKGLPRLFPGPRFRGAENHDQHPALHSPRRMSSRALNRRRSRWASAPASWMRCLRCSAGRPPIWPFAFPAACACVAPAPWW